MRDVNSDFGHLRAAGFFLFRTQSNTRFFLLLQSSRDGYWGFPKGHMEDGETPESAALRELSEETGIDELAIIPGFETTISYQLEKHGHKFLKTVQYFLAETACENVELSEEHSAYKWAKAEDAQKLVAFENLRDTFSRAVEFLAAE